MDWVNLSALAVNEENAAGGRVVTAPTNGAAGIVPAVLHYSAASCHADEGVVASSLPPRHRHPVQGERLDLRRRGRLPGRGRRGVLHGRRGGLRALADASQVENAAEIGMEHNLGMTCDPIGGLVQIPCIERNAMGAVKAINAARMALRGDGSTTSCLDKVIKTMRETGADMKVKYKETSRGGLAVNGVRVLRLATATPGGSEDPTTRAIAGATALALEHVLTGTAASCTSAGTSSFLMFAGATAALRDRSQRGPTLPRRVGQNPPREVAARRRTAPAAPRCDTGSEPR